MSDAIAFLLILPALVLGIVVLDAAGTLGTARYRTSTFAEAAAQHAADALASSPGETEPSARNRWGEMVATIEQSGLAATAGVCDQADAVFNISLVSQPSPARNPGASPSVATVVSCPVPLGGLLATNRVVATNVESVP
ncbi:MAG: hypothetical protein F4124_12630 [Acidimicrobiia bacterium]|nr:hypothetical protein [bacterium]MXW57546.1 hypothetical protein [Acidimicrobiia bacterium]MXZ77592.1 hypothetical protein [Acidimicrobiia bacterium]MXZ84415.1 hypothetical protein [Acidimicrobiia bacterium]MYB09691.1 hypothetical protein [Acidimicrobiia bacterium]